MELPEEYQDGPFFQCYYCGVTETPTQTLKRCSGCQLVTYCSKDCQEFDWKIHKPICKKFPVVNGKNVYHTTEPWEKHITKLLQKAAQLPKDQMNKASQIFSQPKVCKTCHEPQPDRLKVCKCNAVCYCSKKCTKEDKLHKRICSNLASKIELETFNIMRCSYPASFHNILYGLMDSGFRFSSRCGILDLTVMQIHIVTNSVYYDAPAWDVLFETLPKMNILDLTFILQDVPYDESLNRHRSVIPQPGYTQNERQLLYSVYQMPYHMYFSSSKYTEADFVVTYGISNPKYDAHNKISYRNMTNYRGCVLIMMETNKELVSKLVDDVKAEQPSSVVLISPQKNRYRGIGGIGPHHVHINYREDLPNVKNYYACLHNPGGEKVEPFFLKHFEPLLKDAYDPLRQILMKNNGVPEGHL